MQVKIDFEKCKGCALCVTACRQKVLAIGKKSNKGGYFAATVQEPSKCVGCLACAYMCPDSCVEVQND